MLFGLFRSRFETKLSTGCKEQKRRSFLCCDVSVFNLDHSVFFIVLRGCFEVKGSVKADVLK